MIIITSMGGCGSTSFISWFSARIKCNCALNSEGLKKAGPGSNPRGFKHRISPPNNNDKFLLKENSFNRDDLIYEKVDKALFMYDDPINIVPSLFNRKIATGHAIAVSGNRPSHNNDFDKFLQLNSDSFELKTQWKNWSDKNNKTDYKRLLINFNYFWENLDLILDFLGISNDQKNRFPPKRERKSSFNKLTQIQQTKLVDIYGEMSESIKNYPDIIII
jgi:hypothetical protein